MVLIGIHVLAYSTIVTTFSLNKTLVSIKSSIQAFSHKSIRSKSDLDENKTKVNPGSSFEPGL